MMSRCLEHWVDGGLCRLHAARVIDLGAHAPSPRPLRLARSWLHELSARTPPSRCSCQPRWCYGSVARYALAWRQNNAVAVSLRQHNAWRDAVLDESLGCCWRSGAPTLFACRRLRHWTCRSECRSTGRVCALNRPGTMSIRRLLGPSSTPSGRDRERRCQHLPRLPHAPTVWLVAGGDAALAVVTRLLPQARRLSPSRRTSSCGCCATTRQPTLSGRGRNRAGARREAWPCMS